MAKKQLTFTSKILLGLLTARSIGENIFMTPYQWRAKALYGKRFKYNTYRNILYGLRKRGLIKLVDKNNQRFIKLTGKGQLEALLAKVYYPLVAPWDGKWRIIMFDIPEESHAQRDKLRWLLKKQKFYYLQASVYISPHALNREAIQYLKESKLINYIRIIKVEEMDNDKDLKKYFKL